MIRKSSQTNGDCGEDSLALTTAQKLIWTGQQLHPGVPLYNMALAYTIQGVIDHDKFSRAFQLLLNYCDSMRTVFLEDGAGTKQYVRDDLQFDVELVDFSNHADPNQEFERWAKSRCRMNFDLAERSFDSALAKLGDRQFAWFYNQHHVVTDASSFAVIFSKMQRVYSALVQDADPIQHLADLPKFTKYIEFESQTREQSLAREWFVSRTDAVPPKLYGRNEPKSTATSRCTLRLDQKLIDQFREVAMRPGIRGLTRHASQFQLIATVLFALLYRISGQRKLAIGTPSHNRPTREFKQSIGLFIEVFPFAVELEAAETFESLFQKIKIETMSFMRHAQSGASDMRDQRCFNTLLNYITSAFGNFCEMPTTSSWLHSGHCDAGHLIRLQVHDFDDMGELVLHFDLNEEAFGHDRRGRLLHQFEVLFKAAMNDLSQSLDGVDLLEDDERSQLLTASIGAESDANETVVELFEQQVADRSDAVAVVCDDRQLTYGALSRHVDGFAAELKNQGIGCGDTLAIYLPRSPAAIVSILATLKLGAAYIPIDVTNPKGRVSFIVEDAGSPLIITSRSLSESLPSNLQTLIVEPTLELPVEQTDPDNPFCVGSAANPDLPAYLIYTSGSTGQPKGVTLTHANLMHYISWAKTHYVQSRRLSFPLFSPLGFDLTVTSIFLPLVTGGQIVVYPETDRQADLALLNVVEDNLVDIIKLTPSHLALLSGHQLKASRVKQLILGGEDLRCSVAAEAMRVFGDDLQIHNEYGPTEATVGCIVHTYDPASDKQGSVPIGKPIHDMHAHVLNDELQFVPQGVVGELFLAGKGTASGYWRRPELNAERFLKHPLDPNQVLYRTGDLVRIRDDGVFEYHGRIDQQVKIRGVRIELGEIESAIASLENIESCVVDFAEPSSSSSSSRTNEDEPDKHCVRCGLPSNYPSATFSESGVCQLCLRYDAYKSQAENYFRSMNDLEELFARARGHRAAHVEYDCVSLLSGGKDSTYVLGRLVDMGLEVLAFTLDNGYISDQAKANIDRVVKTLGVDHTYGSTPAMNDIFVDSLQRHANVCQGCFKTIYTLSMKLAKEKGIPYIVTGLSRGQFFETRLTEELFTDPAIDVDQIDATILRARKEYHRVDDAVSRLLDVECFRGDEIFDEVRFVDFYRYCDVPLDEMLSYLNQRLPWVRPADTGRSTNCLINDVGIFVHKRDRGFHNYAFPYSWDVRVGHKQRGAALEELDDEIDERRVEQILDEIGYQPLEQKASQRKLVAYYVASDQTKSDTTSQQIRTQLASELPDFMIPNHFVQLDTIPLTHNGKVDRAALPKVSEDRPEFEHAYVAPESPAESKLVKIWQDVLRVKRVGVHDNFFDLGGDSIMAIQIVARANRIGLSLAATQLFDALTVKKLATMCGQRKIVAEQGPVTGPVELTPIHSWFLEAANTGFERSGSRQDFRRDLDAETLDEFRYQKSSLKRSTRPPRASQVFSLRTEFVPEASSLTAAFQAVVQHHDMLRAAYSQTNDKWKCEIVYNEGLSIEVEFAEARGLSAQKVASRVDELTDSLHCQLSPPRGELLAAACLRDQEESAQLIIVADHFAVDAASWPIIIEDLFTAYHQHHTGATIRLPEKTTSFQHWSKTLSEITESDTVRASRDYWRSTANSDAGLNFSRLQASEDKKTRELPTKTEYIRRVEADVSTQLLEELPTRNRRVHEVLLTAVALSLAKLTNHQVVQLDVEGHGRESISQSIDVSRTVGWFTSLYPVALRLPSHNCLLYTSDAADE